MAAQLPVFSPVAFPPLVLGPADPGWPLGVYAQQAVLRYFREALEQRPVVWENTDLEGVHEIRVAARRCRTALQTFAQLWEPKRVRFYERYLEKFATAFGVARDLDVMIIYLREQLAQADGERAAALSWLLARNEQARSEEQPRLERILLKMERDRLPQQFAAFFACSPLNLWALGVPDGQG